MFFIYLLAWLIPATIMGFVSRHIAESKGYDGGFAWGFWLGLIGLLVVGFRPNVDTHVTEYKPMYPEAIQPKETWECKCGSKNPLTIDYCLSCRRKRGEGESKKVKCPHCGANNSEGNVTCFACGKNMDGTEMQAPAIPVKTNVSGNSEDFIEVLEKLAQLKEKGILSEEEFQSKKADILAKI